MELYLWAKALHVISIIAWMAALLYLPRLFVYHCGVEPGSAQSETFKTMERRLLKAIMTPAMAASWIFGLSLIALNPGLLQGQGWLHAKLALVVALSGLHGAMAGWTKTFAKDDNRRPASFYRMMNEVPTALMVAIVILVIVRPF
jgi:protoporphyrinogen IX oxidase